MSTVVPIRSDSTAHLRSINLSRSPATSNVPYRLFNNGNESTVELLRHIEVLEQCLGKKAKMDMLPLQAADVPDHRHAQLGYARCLRGITARDVRRDAVAAHPRLGHGALTCGSDLQFGHSHAQFSGVT